MKILVTGTAGFIGFHLATKLAKAGNEVVGFDNLNEYYDLNLKLARLKQSGFDTDTISDNKLITSKTYSNYSFVKLELEDKKNLEQLFKTEKFDVVVNLAAQAGVRYSVTNPHVYVDSNIVGFTNILENCRYNNIKHLVYASSSSVYGLNESIPFSTSQNVDHPMSLYAASKKSNELMAHVYSHLFKLPTTGLRFFTVYGPWGRPDMALFIFTKSILEGKTIPVYNYGNMLRDFTYVDDVVEGVARVIDNPPTETADFDFTSPDPSSSRAPYKIYNVGNNAPTTLLDFIKAIETKLGMEGKKELLPAQPGDLLATYADIDELADKLHYKPDTSIEHGISEFIDWYKNYYKVN